MIIKYKDYKININSNIIDPKNQQELKETYINMFKLFEKSKTILTTIQIFKLSIDLEKLEYKMQSLFGFPLNRNYHRHWLSVPGCSCPELDNKDYYGTEYRLFDSDCKIHGDKIRNIGKRKEKIKELLKL